MFTVYGEGNNGYRCGCCGDSWETEERFQTWSQVIAYIANERFKSEHKKLFRHPDHDEWSFERVVEHVNATLTVKGVETAQTVEQEVVLTPEDHAAIEARIARKVGKACIAKRKRLIKSREKQVERMQNELTQLKSGADVTEFYEEPF